MSLGLSLGLGIPPDTFKGSPLSPLAQCYIARVEAAGGTVESPSCIDNLGLDAYNWGYACRVNSAGGTIESLQCATIT